MIKAGDYLYCYKDLVMNNPSEQVAFKKGKRYKVIRICTNYCFGDEIELTNDQNQNHYFGFETYQKWFETRRAENLKLLLD